MDTRDRRRVVAAILAGALLAGGGFFLGTRVRASGVEPGSPEDPLVSKSYVDEFVRTYVDKELAQQVAKAVGQQVSAALDQRLERFQTEQVQPYVQQQIGSALALLRPPEPPRFQVVNLQPGQTLWADGGTEVILRAGEATIIAGPGGGLSDVTAGVDLAQGAPVPLNHLLVVPRSDGRGVRAKTAAVLMVRGGYVVQ
ncbi:MAG: hypothetical protein L6E13_05505 [Firmicutes bacterium]|nr:hypothetical protein [Bacillota bacterium]